MHEPTKQDHPVYPNPPATPSGSNRGMIFGCLGCLGVMIVVPLLLMLVGYYVLFHTAVPLRMIVQDDFEMNGQRVEVKGLTGSISSGFQIDKVVMHDDPEDSTIEDIKFEYTGIWDSIRNNRIIIEEFSVGKSVFILDNDFLTSPDGSISYGDFDADEEFDSPEFDEIDESPISLFELRELKIANTTFKSRDGQIKIDIPLIHMSGLKVEGDHFELDELKVTSDFVDLELQDADLDSLTEEDYDFKRTIVGSVHPRVHPLVINEIDFKYHLAASNGSIKGRIEAFGGKYTYGSQADGSNLLELKDFTPGDYFECKNLLVPQNLSVTTRTTDNAIDVDEGHFYLGKTRFDIAKQTIDTSAMDPCVKATANINDTQISATIRESKKSFWPPVSIELESPTSASSTELLALIYHHRSYDELSADEREAIDAISESIDGQLEEPIKK